MDASKKPKPDDRLRQLSASRQKAGWDERHSRRDSESVAGKLAARVAIEHTARLAAERLNTLLLQERRDREMGEWTDRRGLGGLLHRLKTRAKRFLRS